MKSPLWLLALFGVTSASLLGGTLESEFGLESELGLENEFGLGLGEDLMDLSKMPESLPSFEDRGAVTYVDDEKPVSRYELLDEELTEHPLPGFSGYHEDTDEVDRDVIARFHHNRARAQREAQAENDAVPESGFYPSVQGGYRGYGDSGIDEDLGDDAAEAAALRRQIAQLERQQQQQQQQQTKHRRRALPSFRSLHTASTGTEDRELAAAEAYADRHSASLQSSLGHRQRTLGKLRRVKLKLKAQMDEIENARQQMHDEMERSRQALDSLAVREGKLQITPKLAPIVKKYVRGSGAASGASVRPRFAQQRRAQQQRSPTVVANEVLAQLIDGLMKVQKNKTTAA